MFERKDRTAAKQPRMELSIAEQMRPRFNKLRDCATMYRSSPTDPKYVNIKYDKTTYKDFEVYTKGKNEPDSAYTKHEVTNDEGICLPHIWTGNELPKKGWGKKKAAEKKDVKNGKGKRKRGEASGQTPEPKVTRVHELLLEGAAATIEPADEDTNASWNSNVNVSVDDIEGNSKINDNSFESDFVSSAGINSDFKI